MSGVSIYCRNHPDVVAVRYLPALKVRLCADCLRALETPMGGLA